MEALKLVLVFGLVVAALRKKIPVGVTLFGAGLLTALLYQLSAGQILTGYWQLVQSHKFLSVTAIILLITILGALLKELGYLSRLTDSCRRLYGGKRTAAAMLPPLVGLMPMPGGALLSAPLVDEVLSDDPISSEHKCVINYWYRHVVEHFMPIYPGIIMVAAITGLPFGTIALLQVPMAIVMASLGFVFFVRKIDKADPTNGPIGLALWGIASTIWPVALTILIYALFQIELAWAALISIVVLIVITRPKRDQLIGPVKKGLSYKLVFLVFGILSFQSILDQTGAVESLQRLSTEHGLPQEGIIIIVAFASGMLTGMLAALVALSYTLLAGFLFQPVIMPDNILLAFTAGYVGMMASPTHLCLIVTTDYFKADMLKCIRIMVIPLLILSLFGYLLAKSGWPDWVYP